MTILSTPINAKAIRAIGPAPSLTDWSPRAAQWYYNRWRAYVREVSRLHQEIRHLKAQLRREK